MSGSWNLEKRDLHFGALFAAKPKPSPGPGFGVWCEGELLLP